MLPAVLYTVSAVTEQDLPDILMPATVATRYHYAISTSAACAISTSDAHAIRSDAAALTSHPPRAGALTRH